jgi:hypothetical protein
MRALIISDDGTELTVNGRPMIDTTPNSLELNEALDQVKDEVLHKGGDPRLAIVSGYSSASRQPWWLAACLCQNLFKSSFTALAGGICWASRS